MEFINSLHVPFYIMLWHWPWTRVPFIFELYIVSMRLTNVWNIFRIGSGVQKKLNGHNYRTFWLKPWSVSRVSNTFTLAIYIEVRRSLKFNQNANMEFQDIRKNQKVAIQNWMDGWMGRRMDTRMYHVYPNTKQFLGYNKEIKRCEHKEINSL